jgi:hypothetical protein
MSKDVFNWFKKSDDLNFASSMIFVVEFYEK